MRSSVLYMYLWEFLCKLNKTYNKCDMQQWSLFYIHYLLTYISGRRWHMHSDYNELQSTVSRYAIDILKLYMLGRKKQFS